MAKCKALTGSAVRGLTYFDKPINDIFINVKTAPCVIINLQAAYNSSKMPRRCKKQWSMVHNVKELKHSTSESSHFMALYKLDFLNFNFNSGNHNCATEDTILSGFARTVRSITCDSISLFGTSCVQAFKLTHLS